MFQVITKHGINFVEWSPSCFEWPAQKISFLFVHRNILCNNEFLSSVKCMSSVPYLFKFILRWYNNCKLFPSVNFFHLLWAENEKFWVLNYIQWQLKMATKMVSTDLFYTVFLNLFCSIASSLKGRFKIFFNCAPTKLILKMYYIDIMWSTEGLQTIVISKIFLRSPNISFCSHWENKFISS